MLILILSFIGLYIWLLKETNWLRINLRAMDIERKAISDTPADTDTDTEIIEHSKFESMICRKHKLDNPTTHKLPARTIKAFGHTLNFYDGGCNRCRADKLREVRRAQHIPKPSTSKSIRKVICGYSPTEYGYENSIEISIDGKSFNSNGDYKGGDIKKFMADYVGKSGKIKYSLPAPA